MTGAIPMIAGDVLSEFTDVFDDHQNSRGQP